MLFYELRNGLTKVAYPVFVDGTRLTSDSGFVDDVDRRSELARLIVGSEYLAKAHRQPACGPISWATASPSRSTTWGRTIRPRIPNCSTRLGRGVHGVTATT